MRHLQLLFYFLLSMSGYSQNYYLFIGTYTNGPGKSEGIYVYKFNGETGTAQPVSIAKGVDNPTYLTVAPGGKNVYAVNENGGAKPGEVSAFSFDAANGQLQFLNKQPVGGDGPCYVTVDKGNLWALVGNYSGGSLAALPIQRDGTLATASQVIQLKGKGVKPQQEKAHVHATVLSPDQQFVFVPDLGTDKIMIYRFNPQAALPLSPAAIPFVALNPGSGPRHFTFHPSKPYAYVIEELAGNVSAYRYDKGKLTFLQRLSSHPKGYAGDIGSADIHISPDGKFLYASNRGASNTLAIFSIDPDSGKLTSVGFPSTEGVQPRNFIIDPSGQWLLVANQKTSNIVIFKRDFDSGLLQNTGNTLEVPNPVCLQLLKTN